MSRQLADLQTVLSLLIAEHRKLLAEVEKHHAAIKTIDVPGMEASRVRQEALRVAIASIDQRRRILCDQIAAAAKITAPTLTKLAEVDPHHRARILAQRDELRSIAQQINQRSHVAGRVATSVLGHLNTVVRILAGAMQQAGVYTKHGVPRMAPRIGVIEAVG
jgi:hypothetical protein